VLAGVGGRTIAEAKERLTYSEALQWFEYIRRRGSLNLGRRIECGFALLASMYNRAHGGKVEYHDFAPHEDRPGESGEPASIDELVTLFGAVEKQ